MGFSPILSLLALGTAAIAIPIQDTTDTIEVTQLPADTSIMETPLGSEQEPRSHASNESGDNLRGGPRGGGGPRGPGGNGGNHGPGGNGGNRGPHGKRRVSFPIPRTEQWPRLTSILAPSPRLLQEESPR